MRLLIKSGEVEHVDSKKILFDLVEKYREFLLMSHEYVVCSQLLEKIGSTIINNELQDSELDFSEIINLSDEEVAMFTSPDCKRIISSLKIVSTKKGWRTDTILKLIRKLKEDIVNNKMKTFDKEKESLDELSKIIEEDLFLEKSDLILDFIRISIDNKLLSYSDGTKLNFYILNKISSGTVSRSQSDDVEVIELHENIESLDVIRKKVSEIFEKYGYKYDITKMGQLDEKFINYVNVEYLDYVLSKFKEYGIDSKVLYSRKVALCNIVLDNDKNVFDSILNFIDSNKCRLVTLLGIPSVFSRRKKSYIAHKKYNSEGIENEETIFEIFGAYHDFFENIALYKQLSGDVELDDKDLLGLSKFLCTPNSLVRKNLKILEKYGIIKKGELPKAMVSLCGTNTEYIIDRIIEAGLFEKYLSTRINNAGELKYPRGTYFVDGDNNPLKFYKMKRANDIGDRILATNGGIRKIFKDNDVAYNGISMKRTDKGIVIVQEPLTLEFIENINPKIRKNLPPFIQKKVDSGKVSNMDQLYFESLYRYSVYDPVDIFAYSDEKSLTTLRGERIKSIFKNDYDEYVEYDELSSVFNDKFIKLLDEAIYCDSNGNSIPLKQNDLVYEFSYPEISNTKVTVSRFKVLRLCKLLKEERCWVSNKSSNIDIENTILSVILKDMVVSEVDVLVLKLSIKQILSNGLIKVPTVEKLENKRGAR